MKDSNKIIKILSEQEIVKEIDFLKKAFSGVGNLFGKNNAGTQQVAAPGQQPPQASNYDLQRIGDKSFKFGNNVVINLDIFGLPSYAYTEYIQSNFDTFKWLFDSKYYAQYMAIDPKKNELYKFIGLWIDGNFKQGIFGGVEGRGIKDFKNLGFNGGQFNGNIFYLSNAYWKTNPTNFVSGKIKYTEDGILGLPNAENGEITDPIHLTQIPVGKFILIKIQGDSTIYAIQTMKRIDEKDSNFAYKNINNGTASYVTWESIRSKFNNFYISPNKTNFSIPGVISFKGSIETVEVVDNIDNIDIKQKATRKKGEGYSISLNRLPDVFGDSESFKISPEKDQILFAQTISNDFNKNGGKTFLSHLNNIVDEILLTGKYISTRDLDANNLNLIDNLFIKAPIKEEINSNELKSLKYINDFLRLMKSSGRISEVIKGLRDYFSKKLHGHDIKNPEPIIQPTKGKGRGKNANTPTTTPITVAALKNITLESLNEFLKENNKK